MVPNGRPKLPVECRLSLAVCFFSEFCATEATQLGRRRQRERERMIPDVIAVTSGSRSARNQRAFRCHRRPKKTKIQMTTDRQKSESRFLDS